MIFNVPILDGMFYFGKGRVFSSEKDEFTIFKVKE